VGWKRIESTNGPAGDRGPCAEGRDRAVQRGRTVGTPSVVLFLLPLRAVTPLSLWAVRWWWGFWWLAYPGACSRCASPPVPVSPLHCLTRRQSRSPFRPVLKHGPRSLPHARVSESTKLRGATKVTTLDLVCWVSGRRRGVLPLPRAAWRRGSACDETRKMVNYAWAGRREGKLSWRAEAVLTCNSIVWLGYRGERLIEPSSSWFPPKFLPG